MIFGQILLALFLSFHPFYVGLMEIEYFDESRTYGVSLKIFTDDLEKGLEDFSEERLFLATEREHPKADSILSAYLSRKVQLTAEDKIELRYLGKESEYDVTWIYLESEATEPMEKIGVENTILMEIYEDQTHIIHYISEDVTLSELIHKEETKTTFNL